MRMGDDDLLLPYDARKPNIARAYDYLLGGKDNFTPDRELVARLLQLDPGLAQGAKENRQFLIRAVDWVARQGINQFIDVGSGLPTMTNTDEAARVVQPAARVVYVDNDPVAVSHGQALLSGECVVAIPGDLREPDAILADPALTELIDLGEPACLILCAVLHFIDAATARAVTAAFIRALAPGSYLVISVARADGEIANRYMQSYSAGSLHNHSPEQIAGFFAGAELVPPGVVEASMWPVRAAAPANRATVGQLLAGVGRKPSHTG
jgi:SAM-dependent methyltransferase